MSELKNIKYHDLIEKIIDLNNDPEAKGSAGNMYNKLLSEYFFYEEAEENKRLTAFLEDFEKPPFLDSAASILDIDLKEMSKYIQGEFVNSSLAGKIMMSAPYIQVMYPQQKPDFNSLPEDDKNDLFAKIKEKNSDIIHAYEKMSQDIKFDKNRKIKTLLALILKGVSKKTEIPFNKIPKPAEEILKSIFSNIDDIFTAQDNQLRELSDDQKVKQIIKTFFKIIKFDDIAALTNAYNEILDKYKIRTLSALNK